MSGKVGFHVIKLGMIKLYVCCKSGKYTLNRSEVMTMQT